MSEGRVPDSQIVSYFVDRVEHEKGHYWSLYQRLTSSVDSELLGFLPFVSFIMPKPDAYMRGLVPSILDSLGSHKIYPARYQLTSLTEEMIDSLYMFVKQKYFDTWWVMRKAYTLAPCVPCIVVGKRDSYEHLSSRIRELVGPTTPLVGGRDQIRYKLGATHRVLNLVHGTDDPASSAREILVFFGVEDLIECLGVARDLVNDVYSTQRPCSSGFAQLVPESITDLRFNKVLVDAKVSVARAMDCQLTDNVDESALGSLMSKLGQLFQCEYEVLSRNLTMREERAQLIHIRSHESVLLSVIADAIHKQISAIATDDARGAARLGQLSRFRRLSELTELIEVLSNEIRFRYSNFGEVLGSMAVLDVHLDALQEVVLHTGWAVAPQQLHDLASLSPLFGSPWSA